MEGENSTDAIRTLSTKWSLAGDDHILKLLQQTHQRIISKCQHLNSKLEEMSLALDDVGIHLQNVNNKFMALSNSQFIESRVYEDETDILTDNPTTKEPQKAQVTDEISVLKNSLVILDKSHEAAEIVDESDSDDSDAEINVVLRLRNMYSHRPLPHIIGSHQWKMSWHAGLIVEESDTDSSTSRREEVEQYSDTDTEEERTTQNIEEQTISECSSSHTTEGVVSLSTTNNAPIQQTPADIAAELAKRLAGQVSVPQAEVYIPATNKVYKPEKPTTSTIFPDEPPPLEHESSQSEDDDIFAEINKHKPYDQRSQVKKNLAEDLFGFGRAVANNDLFIDTPPDIIAEPPKQKSTLFDDDSGPESIAESPRDEITRNGSNIEKQEENTKKPVGGISLFGSNKGTESIGAAILRRNRRKSSSSNDDSDSNNIPNKTGQEKTKNDKTVTKNVDETDKSTKNNQNDILEGLFVKPQEKTKAKVGTDIKNDKVVKEKVENLFSDNIFDDIDDMFTSNVVKPKETNQRSIFDDDDDLFSDIAQPKNLPKENNRKNIFDSDDELFSDVKESSKKLKAIDDSKSLERVSSSSPNDKGSENIIENTSTVSDSYKNNPQPNKVENIVETTKTTKERNLFDDSPQIESKLKNVSIFESDSGDDMFANIKDSKLPHKHENEGVTSNVLNNKAVSNLKPVSAPQIENSPLLFDDEDEELFNSTKPSKEIGKEIETNVNKGISHNDNVKEPKNEMSVNKTKDRAKNIDESNLQYNLLKDEPQIEQIITKSIPNIDSRNRDSVNDNYSEEKEVINDVSDIVEPSQGTTTEISAKTLQSTNIVIEQDGDIFHAIPKDPSFIDDRNLFKNAVVHEPKFETGESSKVEQKTIDTVLENVETEKVPNEPNVFNQIFSEPPKFEKPAEPKKSKNVNALFDDDSDDEALFFKKDDNITDEKPALFISNANFDMFVDEPPAIDVDFAPKPNKTVHFDDNDDMFSPEFNVPDSQNSIPSNSSNIRKEVEKEKLTDFQSVEKGNNKDSNVEIFSSDEPENTDMFAELEKNLFTPEVKTDNITEEVIFDSNNDLFDSMPPKSSQNTEQPRVLESEEENTNYDIFDKESPKKEEPKKIGRLNTKNFNINVNALMPGASPKKVPKDKEENEPKTDQNMPNDETDKYGEIDDLLTNKRESTDKNTEIVNTRSKEETSPAKSESKESEVLNNNLSKQRARIQVKRRPSSRKARHEAARKSGINFGEETENSIEDVKSNSEINISEKIAKDSLRVNTDVTKDTIEKEEKTITAADDTLKTQNTDEITETAKQNTEIFEPKKTTTKIVYILNDEDIFNTKPNTENKIDNISKDSTKSIETHTSNKQTTLYSHDKDTKKIKDTIIKPKIESLFDDSDEELFKTNKKPLKVDEIVRKPSIFDSDSEDDLFTGKKRTEEKKIQKNKEVKRKIEVVNKVKESLFSDDDDDDDLFGVNKKKIEPKQTSIPTTSKEAIATKTTQPVYDDPLSLLDED